MILALTLLLKPVANQWIDPGCLFKTFWFFCFLFGFYPQAAFVRDANQFSIVGSRGSKYNPSQEPRTPSSSYFDFHLWTIYQFLLCSVIIGYAGTTLLIVTFHSHSEHHFQHYLSIILSNYLFFILPVFIHHYHYYFHPCYQNTNPIHSFNHS